MGMNRNSRIRKKVMSLLISEKEGDYIDESIRQAFLIKLFSVMGLISLISFGIDDFFQDHILSAVVLGVTSLILVANLIYLNRTKNYRDSGWIIVFLLYGLLIFFLLLGDVKSKLLWYYLFPGLAYFILGIKKGMWINISLLILTLVIIFIPVGVLNDAPSSFYQRFLATYISVSAMAHIYEFVRHRTFSSFMRANKKTSEFLERSNRQKDEIEKQANQLASINEELRKISAVVRETDNAVMIMDQAGRAEWVNEGFTKLYKYNLQQLNDAFDENIKDSYFNEHLSEMTHQAQRFKQSLTFESVVNSAQGNQVEVQTTLTPLLGRGKQVSRFITIDTDIRELKDTQRQMRELIAVKDKFFSIIAHDLKSPFNSLIGISRLLIDNADKYDRERMNYFHRNIHKVSKQSYDLLINLLEWSRSQTGQLKFYFEDRPLRQIVDQSISLLMPAAENKEVILENNISEDVYVRADLNTLRTVLRNLISNGIKYSYKGGRVKIQHESRNGVIEVSVNDEGTGIAPRNLNKLFKIHENISAKGTNDESGTGLGLILCKEFVEKNGGTIQASSTPGSGTTISFTLQKGEEKERD